MATRLPYSRPNWQLTLTSYDRLFPNQDTVPKGGFGNLIALPFQNEPREQGRSVFVDAEWQPHAYQWAFLAAIRPMAPHDIEPTVLRAAGGAHPLDLAFVDDEDLATPWKPHGVAPARLPGSMPAAPCVLLATGKLVGEGFDHPPLDTLVLAMPVSWKGTLQQYAGRLHREQAGKTGVRIIDMVDTGYPALLRMWGKRQRGYKAMGYRMAAAMQP